MYALLLTLLSILPVRDGVVRDRCDLTERNHFYDEYGRLVFEQAIFIDFVNDCGLTIEEVRAWRLIKNDGQIPARDWVNGGYVSRWQDDRIFREVRSAMYRESWTQYDPELLAREKFPKDRRRELSANRRVR